MEENDKSIAYSELFKALLNAIESETDELMPAVLQSTLTALNLFRIRLKTICPQPFDFEQFQNRLNKTTTETFEVVPLDDETQKHIRDFVSTVTEHPAAKIIGFIASIITLIQFILGIIPDEQPSEIAVPSQAVLESAEKLPDETIDRLIEIQEQYIELLSEIRGVSGQEIDIGR